MTPIPSKWLGALLLFVFLCLPARLAAAPMPETASPEVLVFDRDGQMMVDDSACRKGDAAACEFMAQTVDGRSVEAPAVARLLYLDACRLGRNSACWRFSELVLPDDKVIADDAARLACEGGQSPACAYWAHSLHARGTQAARSRALKIARRTCEQSGSLACADWGLWLAAGDGVRQDRARALALLRKACSGKASDSCNGFAQVATSGGSPNEAGEARRWLLATCDGGLAEACFAAGRIALDSRAGPPDFRIAGQAIARSCAAETLRCGIGHDVRDRDELEADCHDATTDGRSCGDLGDIYADADLPIRDHETALRFYELGCLRDDMLSCNAGAELIDNAASTNGPGRDLARLRLFAARACGRFSPERCLQAADLFDRAEGGPRDPVQVQTLLLSACKHGVGRACMKLDQLQISDPGLPAPEVDENYEPETDRLELAYDSVHPAKIDCATELAFRGRLYEAFPSEVCAGAIGGAPVPQGGAPWQALIERPANVAGRSLSGSDRVLCGGSLVATGWILTAAHCLIDSMTDNDSKPIPIDIKEAGYTVRLGMTDMTKAEGLAYRIIDTKPYGKYSGDAKSAFAYDIALVKIDYLHPIVLGAPGKIRMIRLDPAGITERPIVDGAPVYVTGWGWTTPIGGRASPVLNIARLELKSAAACTQQTQFLDDRKDSILCAAGTSGQQACHGDSGGPLISYDGTIVAGRRIYEVDEGKTIPTVIGIVSRGACGANGLPSRYTRVAKFADWINETIGGTSAH